jgi:hypothetical protein
MLTAFAAMTRELGSRDAAPWLIDEVDRWEDRVWEAARRADAAAAPPECTDVAFAGAATRRTWRASSWAIVTALGAQADAARRGRLEAAEEAEAEDRSAAAAEAGDPPGTAAAARHRENAAAARERAARLLAWEIAARDAHGHGSAVLAGEQPVGQRIGEAIAHAGGAHEVPRDRNYAGPVPAGTGRRYQ